MEGVSRATVLVTGGTGFIGGHLVERLVSLGSRVRCLVRRSSSLQNLPVKAVELTYGDLTAGEGLREALQDINLVFHLAGVTKANSAADYYSGNAAATQTLMRACVEVSGAGLRLIHVSSLSAVGPSADGIPLSESATPHPLSHYGKSKLQAEQAVRSSPLSAHSVIIRPPVVYGPRDTDVYQMFRAINKGWFFRIGAEESFISMVYVGDLVEALLRAAENGRAAGKTYFAAHPDPVSWSEFAATAAALLGRKIRVIVTPGWAAYAVGFLAERSWGRPTILSREKVTEARQRYWTCDVSRARQDLDFCAKTSLREGMAETLTWYKQAGWLK